MNLSAIYSAFISRVRVSDLEQTVKVAKDAQYVGYHMVTRSQVAASAEMDKVAILAIENMSGHDQELIAKKVIEETAEMLYSPEMIVAVCNLIHEGIDTIDERQATENDYSPEDIARNAESNRLGREFIEMISHGK